MNIGGGGWPSCSGLKNRKRKRQPSSKKKGSGELGSSLFSFRYLAPRLLRVITVFCCLSINTHRSIPIWSVQQCFLGENTQEFWCKRLKGRGFCFLSISQSSFIPSPLLLVLFTFSLNFLKCTKQLSTIICETPCYLSQEKPDIENIIQFISKDVDSPSW